MELGYSPSFNSVTNGFGKYLKTLKNSGANLKQINHLQLILKQGYDMYKSSIAGKYKTIAIKLDVYIRVLSMYYLETIPLILANNNSIIPVFDSQITNGNLTRNNRIRFACACISSMLGKDIKNYMVLDFSLRKGITKYEYSLDGSKSADMELRIY